MDSIGKEGMGRSEDKISLLKMWWIKVSEVSR